MTSDETTSSSGPGFFPYQHLKDGHIRLIKIHPSSTGNAIRCSIHHSDLEDAKDDYIALSYCWGDPSITKSITLGDYQIQVTENLSNALTSIVQHHDRDACYWIDALCINQNNIPERNHHVQRMGTVYSSARLVSAWLGPEDAETETAFSEITLLASANIANRDEPPDQRVATAIGSLASRPYFDRAWVIQESIRARSLQILCGRFSCNWSALDACVKGIEMRSNLEFDYTVGTSYLLGGRGAHISPEPDTAGLSHWEKFYGCMMIFSQAQCFDPRDRVFASLGHPWLESIPAGLIRVDYSLAKEEVVLTTLEACERIRTFEREVEANGLSQDDEEIVEAIWQQMTLTICQADVAEEEKELTLFKDWVRQQDRWDCSRLPEEIVAQSGRKVNCTGPVLTFLLQQEDINTTSDAEGGDAGESDH